MQIIAPLLRGERVTFEGRYHRAVDVELRPAPIRAGGPPILIAGKQPRMLGLVAEHADHWNAAWYGRVAEADVLRTRLADLRAALVAAERDPATLTLTAGIFVSFDDDDPDVPEQAIRGSLDEVATALAEYADLGISHLITHLWPRTPDAVARLADAAALARERIPTPV
jgi:FMNH2-dependent dimethyl sulfone monooxygenase